MVAHSGAGVLAPVVLNALPAARTVVLVDAVLPAVRGDTAASAGQRDMVRDLAVDGVLPPWTSWWDEKTLIELVPDTGDRALLVAGAPQLPVAFYDVAVPAPDGWEPPTRGYLQLSPAYDDVAVQARQRGWHTVSRPGRHLDVLSAAGPVADAVLALLAGA